MPTHYHNMFNIILVILIKYTTDNCIQKILGDVRTQHISFMIEKSLKVKLK